MVLSAVKKLFGSQPQQSAMPRTPDGERFYVIGDIHGRFDLFEALVAAINKDDSEAGSAKTTAVLLGDLVDRGADSAGVIRLARQWGQQREVRYLAGNHEEMFLESFDDKEVLRHFLKHGGRETILSYGIPKKEFDKLSVSDMFAALPTLVPIEDRQFLENFEEMIIAGDYLFVHAGINPKVPLEEQTRKDMLWIRDRFLNHEGAFPKVVVHGHTIFDEVMDTGSRIGIDTGAFRSGVLTALVLEAEERRIIQAIDNDGSIEILKEDTYA